MRLDGAGRVDRTGVALMGMGPTPLRVRVAEQALLGLTPDEVDLAAFAEEAVSATNPADDVHASGSYRKHVARGLLRRALAAALKEAAR